MCEDLSTLIIFSYILKDMKVHMELVGKEAQTLPDGHYKKIAAIEFDFLTERCKTFENHCTDYLNLRNMNSTSMI
jgi:hypothetical protein